MWGRGRRGHCGKEARNLKGKLAECEVVRGEEERGEGERV